MSLSLFPRNVTSYKLGLFASSYGTNAPNSYTYRWLDDTFPEWSAWTDDKLTAGLDEECAYVEGQ